MVLNRHNFKNSLHYKSYNLTALSVWDYIAIPYFGEANLITVMYSFIVLLH